jgi:NADH-quinone oxidoreductase subunit M
MSLAIAILVFVMSLSLWTGFDSSTHLMQFVEKSGAGRF